MDVDEDAHGGKWWTGWMVCRMCGHRQMAIVPVADEEDDVLTRCECAHCGSMTSEKED